MFSVSPNDPVFSPDDELSSGNYLTAAASVTAVPVTAVPEAASISLLGAVLLVAVLRRIRDRRLYTERYNFDAIIALKPPRLFQLRQAWFYLHLVWAIALIVTGCLALIL